MGIFDNAKDKLTDAAKNHPDQANSAVDRAGDMVDEKTGGKFAGQVDQGQDAVRGHLGADTAGAPEAPAAPGGDQGADGGADDGAGAPVPGGDQGADGGADDGAGAPVPGGDQGADGGADDGAGAPQPGGIDGGDQPL